MILILKCYECSELHEIDLKKLGVDPIEIFCSCKYTRVKLAVKE